MAEQIRFLVRVRDDIQKLRIATFNRIVSYLKPEAREKFKIRIEDESHIPFGDQNIHASHPYDEPQGEYASHYNSETHSNYAAQFKPSEIAWEMVSGKREAPKELEPYIWLHENLLSIEKELEETINAWSRDHPVRVHFLDHVRGIGGVLASGIIAWLSPISRFPNISKLWKYCGLAPGQRRVRGQPCGYNPKLKSFMWKIATSFEKQNPEKSFYRRIYEQKKKYYMEREDIKRRLESGEKGVKQHIRMMALRYTVKRFLADLWLQWRKLEGLPVTKPYAHAVLGHSEYEEWKPDK